MKNILAGMVTGMFFLALTSCSKSETIIPEAASSAAGFENWMKNNVRQIAWADAGNFYWQVAQAKLDNVAITTNGIGYQFSPGKNMHPSIEQTTEGGYLRTLEIGNPVPVWCPYYRDYHTRYIRDH